MSRITEHFKERRFSPYIKLSEKYGVTYQYVWKIAKGVRKPNKGKGLKVLRELELMTVS